jgi:23S rRNA (guanine745-N1)-methyltransferase
MLSKVDYLKQNLSKTLYIYRCPICQTELKIDNNSLVCLTGHTYNLAKKGYLVLYKSSNIKSNKIYDNELFISRKLFIDCGFYDSLHKLIADIIKQQKNNSSNILDMGCGEATHDYKIKKILDGENTIIGIDISKDGIEHAGEYNSYNIIPIISDLNNLPIKDKTIDIILNILSPSNEKEMARVLKENGIIIKVTPKKEYLKEVREILSIHEYMNELEITNNIYMNYDVINKYNIEEFHILNKESFNYLKKMTPLLKGVEVSNRNLEKITIALNVYILKPKQYDK